MDCKLPTFESWESSESEPDFELELDTDENEFFLFLLMIYNIHKYNIFFKNNSILFLKN